jgi:glucuronosyltransferase
MQTFFSEYFDIMETFCRDMGLNNKFMTKLQESRFDVSLADAVVPCGELLAELLNIPFCFLPDNTHEKYSGGLPVSPFYVPVITSELTDQMTFMDQVKNMLFILFFDFWFQIFDEKWNQFYTEVLGKLCFSIFTVKS